MGQCKGEPRGGPGRGEQQKEGRWGTAASAGLGFRSGPRAGGSQATSGHASEAAVRRVRCVLREVPVP